MIGYYGGSFDPVHNGHIEIARFIAGLNPVDSVCFVPAGTHPLGKRLSPFHHRMEMLRLAIDTIPGLCLSDADSPGSGPSYTIDLLRRLEQTVDSPFFFIAGIDNLNQLFDWKDWAELIRSFPVVFTSRFGVEIEPAALERVSETVGRAVPVVDTLESDFSTPLILTVPDYAISSTEIRKMILNGKLPSGMIQLGVLDYIKTHDLYRKG